MAKPHLTVAQILAWADTYHARTGSWPRSSSGAVLGAPGENWSKLESALRIGARGLPGGSSLARLLEKQRQIPRYAKKRRPFTEKQILAWADAYHARTGHWPTRKTGRIAGAGGQSWRGVEWALRAGRRGLPGGCTLSQFLAARRPGHRLTPLTEEQILAWADAHHARTGQWPKAGSGSLEVIPDLKWSTINHPGVRFLPTMRHVGTFAPGWRPGPRGPPVATLANVGALLA